MFSSPGSVAGVSQRGTPWESSSGSTASRWRRSVSLALFWAPSTGVTFDLEDYVYFTNQSNLLLAVVMLWGGIAVLARRDGASSPGCSAR